MHTTGTAIQPTVASYNDDYPLLYGEPARYPLPARMPQPLEVVKPKSSCAASCNACGRCRR